jgi:hypothetical protein
MGCDFRRKRFSVADSPRGSANSPDFTQTDKFNGFAELAGEQDEASIPFASEPRASATGC